MNKTLHMILVLTIVGFVSGAALVFMYKYADPLIIANKNAEMEEAIYKLFGEAKSYEKVDVGEETAFRMKAKDGRFLGYAFIAEGNGYQGTIKMMAGVDPDLVTLRGIEILESQETPGLGQEITNPDFRSQFNALKAVPEITYIKNEKPSKPNEIQAITGATVSSSAVVSILNEKIKFLRGALNE